MTGRVTIIGGGTMGTVLAILLADKGVDTALWHHRRSLTDGLAVDRENRRYLPGHRLPESVRLYAEPAGAPAAIRGATLLVNAVPTQFIRPVWASLAVAVRAADPGGTLPILSVAKGIEAETLLRPTQVLADALGGGRPLCALAGPAIGPEIARCLPATLVAASPDAALAAAVQETFSTDYLRLYTNGDLTGAELAGAAKNVIAIAAGILDGLRCGDNAKAGLLTRGLAEIVRLGTAMGARPETFYGLAGVGDLITTAISPVGRNRSVGEALGRGRKLDEILATAGHVAEGVSAVRGLLALAARHGVEMPIAESVRDVLFAGKDPITAISGLMSRSRKPETPAVSTAAPTR